MGIPSTEYAPTPRLRAATYRRVSTEEQATDERVSLGIQEADMKAHCERRGYDVTRSYEDAGYSAESRNRPGFLQMCEDAEAGKFDVIVCWRGDRLCRGFRPYVVLSDALVGTDIEIEAFNDFVSRQWLSTKVGQAQAELDALRERSYMGHRGRARNGKIISPPYGYAIGKGEEDGKPIVVNDEAEVVRRIFSMYLSGDHSYETIAQALNNGPEPLFTRRFNKWVKQDIEYIIGNTAYMGKGEWGKRHRYKKDDGKGRDVSHIKLQPQERWIEIDYPPIIDEETFQAAQRRRIHYTIPKVGRMETLSYPLKGILWCAQHNRPYTTSYTANKGESVYRYYQCNKGSRLWKEGGKCALPKPSSIKVETAAKRFMFKHLIDPEKREELRQHYMAQLREGGGVSVIERWERELEKLENERRGFCTSTGRSSSTMMSWL